MAKFKSTLAAVAALLSLTSAHASSPVAERVIHVPSEQAGQYYDIRVIDEKILDERIGYKYISVPESQTIETLQVKLTLSRSPLAFRADGTFLGFIPQSGIVKKSKVFEEFILDSDSNGYRYLLVDSNFAVVKAAAKNVAVIHLPDGQSFQTLFGEFEFEKDRSLAHVHYRVPVGLARSMQFFPRVQGISLTPTPDSAREWIKSANIDLVFDAQGYVRKIFGAAWDTSWPISRSSEVPMRFANLKLPAQPIALWNAGLLGMELSPEGLLTAAMLSAGIDRTIDGKSVNLSYFNGDSIGSIETKIYRGGQNTDGTVAVDGYSILDPIAMGLGYSVAGDTGFKLCRKLGPWAGPEIANPISKAAFFMATWTAGKYTMIDDGDFYDPTSGNIVTVKAGNDVSLIKSVSCPKATSFPL